MTHVLTHQQYLGLLAGLLAELEVGCDEHDLPGGEQGCQVVVLHDVAAVLAVQRLLQELLSLVRPVAAGYPTSHSVCPANTQFTVEMSLFNENVINSLCFSRLLFFSKISCIYYKYKYIQ